MLQVNVVTTDLREQVRNAEGDFPGIKFIYGEEQIEKCDILFGLKNLDFLLKMPKLKFVQTTSSGVDRYVKGGFPSHVKLASASGAYNLSISEFMLGLHLGLYRNMHVHRDCQNQCHWQDWRETPPTKIIKDSTVLIIGMGGIGGEYAKLVKALGAYVIGVRRSDLTPSRYADEIHLVNELDALLPRADMVAIVTPSTGESYQMLNAQRFALMKDGAMLINVGRGKTVDTTALCDALDSGKLSGAALDVTDPEPLPKEHRLWKIKNAVITPHCAGGSELKQTADAIFEIFKENLKRFQEGRQLVNEIDFETQYRKLDK